MISGCRKRHESVSHVTNGIVGNFCATSWEGMKICVFEASLEELKKFHETGL
jgi:hypothetical protein